MVCGVQVDLQLESGEYFLAQDEKAERAKEAQQQKQADRVAERKRKREAAFEVPAQVTGRRNLGPCPDVLARMHSASLPLVRCR